jgi:hypothetical protein
MELALLEISMMAINVLEIEDYIIALGLRGLHLVKNLMPSQSSPVRKRVRSLRMYVREIKSSDGGSFICY